MSVENRAPLSRLMPAPWRPNALSSRKGGPRSTVALCLCLDFCFLESHDVDVLVCGFAWCHAGVCGFARACLWCMLSVPWVFGW
mmetsp:Transcript_10897/g.15534  ORF Transcript_10897/g.15534 Transcript_10897/m.15534 type:complete len:84 (-) Transcript_10897:184-435(-)